MSDEEKTVTALDMGPQPDPAPEPDPQPEPDPAEPKPEPDPAPKDGDPEPDPKPDDEPKDGDDPKPDEEPKDEPPEMPEWDAMKKAIAGEDEKLLKKLDRYNSLADFGKAHANLLQRLSAGDFSEKLPKDATPEQVKEWREKNGIPEKPEGYKEFLPEGLVLGEQDENILNGVLFSAHEANIPPEAMKAVLDGYNNARQAETDRIMENDANIAKEVSDQLKQEWGENYKVYNNQLLNFLDNQFGSDVVKRLMAARLNDDNMTPLFSDPDFINGLTQVARIMNPNPTKTGHNEGNLQTVQDRIKEIEKTMNTKPGDYWNDAGMQKELKELYEVEESMSKQKA